MSADAPESSRTEARLRSYRRTMLRAFALSMGIHLAGAVLLDPSAVMRWFRRGPMIGYGGGSHWGDLAPQGEPREREVSLVRGRRFTGPVTLISTEIVGTSPALREVPSNEAPAAGAYAPEGTPEERTRGNPRTGGSGSGVVIELGEDWAVVPGSGDIARSQRFQTLKIVRPEYPTSAIRAGLQGVVRLEVLVDSTGKVAQVTTRENNTLSRDLEEAAIHAMFLWEFSPYREDHRPVPFTVLVPFRYRLID
jgi:TonB family protein